MADEITIDFYEDGWMDGIAEGRQLEREENEGVVVEIQTLALLQGFSSVLDKQVPPGTYRLTRIGGKE